MKLNHRQPLFVEIPDRHGTGRKPNFITAYVNEAIGLRNCKRKVTNLTTEGKITAFPGHLHGGCQSPQRADADEYMTAPEKTFEEHKADTETGGSCSWCRKQRRIEREINKQGSGARLRSAGPRARKQEELKDKLFVELRDMLQIHLETQDYQKLLERQVKQAVEFAGNDQMIIYLDPVDEDKLNRLALHNGNAELPHQ